MSKDTGFSITSAERYSLALYELSTESNVTSQIEEQSISVLKLLEQSQDFSNLIKDPTTSQDDLLKVVNTCLLYTSPSPRDRQKSRMPSSA